MTRNQAIVDASGGGLVSVHGINNNLTAQVWKQTKDSIATWSAECTPTKWQMLFIPNR